MLSEGPAAALKSLANAQRERVEKGQPAEAQAAAAAAAAQAVEGLDDGERHDRRVVVEHALVCSDARHAGEVANAAIGALPMQSSARTRGQ